MRQMQLRSPAAGSSFIHNVKLKAH
jgi:hypothetical protein